MGRFPTLSSKFVLAPMSGISDVAFRTLCVRRGAGLCTTELTSASGLVRGVGKPVFSPEEKVKSLQIFGNNFEDILKAAKDASPYVDILDFNLGCPKWRITRQGCGSQMMGDIDEIKRIVGSVTRVVDKPFTVKIRSGVDSRHINCVEVARVCERAGASAICVHPRTAVQGYSGKADWRLIFDVKKAVSVPVIGNGDVFSAPDAFRMIEDTNCDYVMIGRGAIGNPGIFSACLGKEASNQILDFFEYLELVEKLNLSFERIRFQASNFTKGIEGSARMRGRIVKAKDVEEIKKIFEEKIN